MKLLIDQNISNRMVNSISDIFPGSKHVLGLSLNDASDTELWEYALENDFALISTEEQMFDRNIVSEKCPKIIYVKGELMNTTKLEWALRVNEEIIHEFMDEGSTWCLQLTL
jgi:predicted nuclease of predicted toxin-antitoxin system